MQTALCIPGMLVILCGIIGSTGLPNIFNFHKFKDSTLTKFRIFTADGDDSDSGVYKNAYAGSDIGNYLKYQAFRERKKNVDAKCGYKSCDVGKPGMLNVHLVAHTHDDVGWIYTIDQYYYQSVQYILDNAITELSKDSRKRFIYVEIAFFVRWWDEQHDLVRHLVKGLVSEGRLEFILGGWCMSDEATTHYNAIIDQHTVGFEFLKQNFGECGVPKVAWQIDPFGHSREQASLFAQFGFDGLFFGRLDYQDKDNRLKKKEMELMWMASENLGSQASLFTGALYNHYMPPEGFQFNYGDPDIMDDDRLDEYNVDDRVKAFMKVVLQQGTNFTTNHIMLTMGGDFQYRNAHVQFKNMDKLITYVNSLQQKSSKRVNVFYSTPSCYLYAVNQANQTYTTKTDDFFPYAHRPHSFWTGYFTNRPALKGMIRKSNNLLQVCKQLDVLSQLEAKHGTKIKVNMFRKAVGAAQHHDAVTGTERQVVAYDYAKRLSKGAAACQEVINSAYGELITYNNGSNPPVQVFCNLLNVSYCQLTEDNNKFTVVLYNPIASSVAMWIHIPVTQPSYSVVDSALSSVQSQMVPVSAETKRIPENNGSHATKELVFKAVLPPLGFNTYFVTANSRDAFHEAQLLSPFPSSQDYVMKNKHMSVQFDASTGRLKSLTNLDHSITVPMQQGLAYYKGFFGNNSEARYQASGAYIFRPNGSDSIDIANKVKVYSVKGKQVQEVHQILSSWASQVIRLYEDERYVEFEWTVGPIPIQDGIGKEVISWYKTDMKSNATFYTDSNGREILKRIRDFRPTWKLNQTESVAGNYYPVNSRMYIRDESKDMQLTILTDRSQGGTSIRDGELELMVHRRLLVDDALGVGEATNETGSDGRGLIVRGKHYVLLDNIANSARLHRALARQLFMSPIVTFAPLKDTPSLYSKTFTTEWSGVNRALPDNVHLLTLEQWQGRTYLLRLEHFYERNEDKVLSQQAAVSLMELFVPFYIESVDELTLGANQRLAEATRLQWNVHQHGKTPAAMASHVSPVDEKMLTIKLQPMQIRTFQVSIK